MPGQFKVDRETGFVKPSHEVSVFDNPESVISTGRVPHQVNTATVSESLQIIQRGPDLKHFEITPVPGANLTPEQYKQALECIKCKLQ